MLRMSIIAVLSVYVLAMLALLIAPAQSEPERDTGERARRELPQMVGMTLNVYHTQDVGIYLDAVDQIAALGFNTVHVTTPVFQRNGASNEINRPSDKPGRALPRDELLQILKRAKAKGLTTTLMPQVNFTQPRGNEWRGEIQPQRWRQWWAEYKQMIEYHLAIANEADVDMFIIGCELLSTQSNKHLHHWREIIETARDDFDGALSYSTNWDSYDEVLFWDELDAIGISGYWDLTTQAENAESPSDEALANRWHEIRTNTLRFARAKDRPVVITELGYPSLPWALRDPWNYINSDDLDADHAVQARGYRSFLAAWSDVLTPPAAPSDAGDHEHETVQTPQATWRLPDADMAGVFFYRWDPYYHGGPEDTGYGVSGKPAMDILKQWLAKE